jgi:hypothetical protein
MAWEPPRRIREDKLVPAEKAISDAQRLVEEMPPDERLTHAGTKLQEARALVADFVDGVPFGSGYPRPVPEPARRDPHADLAHAFSKWAGVEHSGTPLDGTTVARQILHDFRAALNPTMLPPPAPVPAEEHDTDPAPPLSARRELPTLPDGAL